MARPIRNNPVIKGKAVREFERIFMLDAKPDPKKIERNKSDVALYRATKVVR